MPSPSEAPSGGAKPFAYFLAFEKVSRRKGETISGRYRSNGYVLGQHNTTQHNTTQVSVSYRLNRCNIAPSPSDIALSSWVVRTIALWPVAFSSTLCATFSTLLAT